MILAVDSFGGPSDPYAAGVLPLWQTSFGDEPGYILRFLHECPKRCYLWLEGQSVAAMLFVLPSKLAMNGAEYDTGYIYAAATHPSLRGRGIMSQLVRHAHEDMKHYPYFALLPANAGLYDFYARLGYRAAFSRSESPLTRGQLARLAGGAAPARPVPFDFDRFSSLRRAALAAAGSQAAGCFPAGSLLWSGDSLRYVLDEYVSDGGRAVLFDGGYLLWRMRGGGLFVSELSMPGGLSAAAAYLLEQSRSGRFTLILPRRTAQMPAGELSPYGMLWARDGSSIPDGGLYFNLGLD